MQVSTISPIFYPMLMRQELHVTDEPLFTALRLPQRGRGSVSFDVNGPPFSVLICRKKGEDQGARGIMKPEVGSESGFVL